VFVSSEFTKINFNNAFLLPVVRPVGVLAFFRGSSEGVKEADGKVLGVLAEGVNFSNFLSVF
jgi:hypothetical protein